MKSNTVRFNIYMLLGVCVLVFGNVANMPTLPLWVYTALTISTCVISQLITYFDPSGTFVGSGQDWAAGKWIFRIGTSLLSIFAVLLNLHVLVMAVAAATPILETIIRIFGSDSVSQNRRISERFR